MKTSIIEYKDPVEGFGGWLAYDGVECSLAAGGCRVQPGLTAETLESLAARMTLKERLLGINVDGAKCGIDYDPRSPGKTAALRRFLAFLRDELYTRFSMGCDMGTQWKELEELALRESIPSIKYAVKTAQGLSDEEFFARIGTLDHPVGALTLAERRAGHALAHAALAAANCAGLPAPLSFSLQGFGNLGRAAACTLAEQGMPITAIADEYGCVADAKGLDVPRMLASTHTQPVVRLAPHCRTLASRDLFDLPADVLILAAGQDAMTLEAARALTVPVVVVGANCGLTSAVERVLCERGVFVVPDFIGGIGGSASMEALFGPALPPSPRQVLDTVAVMLHQIVDEVASIGRAQSVPLRAAALALAQRPPQAGARPYGCSPYAAHAATAVTEGAVR